MRLQAAPLSIAAAALAVTFFSSASFGSEHVKTSFQKRFAGPQFLGRRYNVRLFASGTKAYYNPDPVVVDSKFVDVAYQNATKPDGSDGGDSTIVQYRHDGSIARIVKINGHCDGLRENPSTHELWALVNNDANPALYTIAQGAMPVRHTYVGTKHGGGYDDVAFVNGKAFVSGSNPTLDHNGINTGPAVYSIALSGTKATVTPVLMGNQSGVTDVVTGQPVTIDEVDPDAMTVDANGNVVLVNQGGSEIVTIANAGTTKQSVSRLLVGTQLDDTVFVSGAAGSLVVTDITANATYVVRTQPFVPGTVYTEAPSDSGVASFVGTLDPKTGIVTPVLAGLLDPSGLLFVPGNIFP